MTNCAGFVAIATTILAGTAYAQPHHAEIMAGMDAAGRLHMHHHAEMPFILPPSAFPGINGFAHAEVAFASLNADHPAIGLFLLPQTVDLRAVLVSADPGLQVYGGLDPLPLGGQLVLGAPVIHYMPIWNITSIQPGEVKTISFFFRDASGQLTDSDVFSLSFTVPAPASAFTFATGGLILARRRRR